jgi:hypothetical protein
MNILDKLFGRGKEEAPMPLSSEEEVRMREQLHAEWERDFARRTKRLYELEKKENFLTSRLFPPAPNEEEGHRGK